MKGQDEVKKFIRILIAMEGVEESTEKAKKHYKTHQDGLKDAKKDAEDAAPKIEDFLTRWKYQLMLVGGAVTAIYGMIRYSSVAHNMIDLLGRSVGFLADVILVNLYPFVMLLAMGFLWLAKAIMDLPDIFKDIITWGVTAGIILWGVNTALAAIGISAATTGLILSALAGLAIGIIVVLTLREMGVTKQISDWAGNMTSLLRHRLDQFSVDWHNFWVDAFMFVSNMWNETLGKLPGMPRAATEEDIDKLPSTARWKDMYDLAAAEAYNKVVREQGVKKAVELWGGDQWKQTAEDWRKTGTPDAETGRWTYKPLTDEDLDRMPGDQAFLRFGKWLYGEEKGTGGLGEGQFPTDILDQLEASYPKAPSTIVPATTPQGAGAGAAATTKGTASEITIQNANIYLNPDAIENRAFFDQVSEIANRTNSTALKRRSTYG